MRALVLLSAVCLMGCGDSSSGQSDCENDATDMGGPACGLNDSGTEDRLCVEGAWVEQGTCSNDPDICSNGDTDTGGPSCGVSGNGTEDRLCEGGIWVNQGTCTNDPGTCTDDDTDTGGPACGLNDRGTEDRLCVSGTWVNQGTCTNDPDVCIDDDTDTGGPACGINGNGTEDRLCVAGAWVNQGTCTNDPGSCTDNDTDTGGPACGLNDRGTEDRLCVSGTWVNQGTCSNDPDVCTDNDSDTGGPACGLNDRGTEDRLCVTGVWVNQGTCSNDPDVCTDNDTDTGGPACGLNNNGTEDRLCQNGAWSNLGTCSNDPDVCVNTTTRPCGTDTGECTIGVETCSGGAWGACSGTPPVAETCDHLDNNCSSVTDEGVTTNCSYSDTTNLQAEFTCLPGNNCGAWALGDAIQLGWNVLLPWSGNPGVPPRAAYLQTAVDWGALAFTVEADFATLKAAPGALGYGAFGVILSPEAIVGLPAHYGLPELVSPGMGYAARYDPFLSRVELFRLVDGSAPVLLGQSVGMGCSISTSQRIITVELDYQVGSLTGRASSPGCGTVTTNYTFLNFEIDDVYGRTSSYPTYYPGVFGHDVAGGTVIVLQSIDVDRTWVCDGCPW